nr:iron-containing alcohol dehydrogenase [Parageobacillus thermoglucosidasius]
MFGEGSIQKLPEVLEQFGAQKTLLVYDNGVKAAGIIDKVYPLLSNSKMDVVSFDKVLPNPPDTIVEEGQNWQKRSRWI